MIKVGFAAYRPWALDILEYVQKLSADRGDLSVQFVLLPEGCDTSNLWRTLKCKLQFITLTQPINPMLSAFV